MAYNLHDLRVIGLNLSEVLDCEVKGRIGEHSSLTLHAYLEDREAFLLEMPAYQPVEIQLEGKEGIEILFSGIVTEISFRSFAEMRIVRIEGKSYSWLMDLTKKSRSFQDTQMSYAALINQVLTDYPDGSVYYAAPDLLIGRLIVQYQETDWEFLKRIMSMIGLTVTPFSEQAGIRLYAGIPALPETEIPYRILGMDKDMETFYHLKAIGYPIFAADFTRYKIQSERLMRIFETIKVSGQPLTIYSYRYDFKTQEMSCTYELQMTSGLLQAAVYPMHLIGVALMGTVVQAAGDKVQVALEIDRESGNPPAYWFTYSTMSASPDGSGWYCMPETGDDVRVYFPSKQEWEAIALSAVSNYGAPGGGQADRMQDPNSRYLRTRDGQELALAPGFMKLSCGEGLSSATILEDGTVTISAQNEVSITAKKDVTIHAEEELTLHSKGVVTLQSFQGGKIGLGGQMIEFKGTEVKFD